MTIDEAIKHAKKVAEVQEEAAKEWHENQVRKCELIPFAEMDYTHENNCKKCADEHRQLAEWLKELKQLREQTRWIPVSERLPKNAGVYIVTREFTDGFECADLTDACYFDGTSTWHNDNRINHGREYVDKKIKAWMHLPSPYELQESEKINCKSTKCENCKNHNYCDYEPQETKELIVNKDVYDTLTEEQKKLVDIGLSYFNNRKR